MKVTSWTKTTDGYETRATTGERIELLRSGRRWLLAVAGEQVADLGRLASFDHAEGVLKESN